MRRIFLWVLALLAVYGCSKMEPVSGVAADESGETPIVLQGVIDPVGTRAGGVIDGQYPATDLGIAVYRTDANSTTANDYAGTWSTNYAATWESSDGDINFGSNKVTYLRNGWKTRLIGLYYPDGARTDNVVTIPFDGYTDVMCSQIIEGSSSDEVDDFVFKHLLTQVQVFVKGEDAYTIQEWGAITSLKLKGRSGNLAVTLPEPNIATDLTAAVPTVDVTGNDDTQVPRYNGTQTYNGNFTFDETERQYGLIMFPPANSELSFEIETVYGGTAVVVTTENITSFSVAKAYAITLVFKADGTIGIGIGGSASGSGDYVEWQAAGDSEKEDLDVE
jgi:hypothetical protein